MPRKLVILRIAYNGSGFHGYQRQPGLRTIEHTLFQMLSVTQCIETSIPENYSYSGRTDKGVHALSQTIAFLGSQKCSVEKLVAEVDRQLGSKLLIWAYRLENEQPFHARRWALWREYVYVDDAANYKCTDADENIREARNVLSQRIHLYAYRGFARFTPDYLERRVLRISLKTRDKFFIWGIMGESFPHNFVRRLIHLLRTRPCGKQFMEHAMESHQGLAEPGRLVLASVKYPLSLKRLLEDRELYERLKDVFKRESFVLQNVIYFYQNEKTFSRPF